MKGAAAWATLMRSSEDTLGSLMMPRNRAGIYPGCAGARRAFRLVLILLAWLFFRSLLFWPINPLTRHVPFLGRRGPKPQPEAQRHQCAGRLSRAPGE